MINMGLGFRARIYKENGFFAQTRSNNRHHMCFFKRRSVLEYAHLNSISGPLCQPETINLIVDSLTPY